MGVATFNKAKIIYKGKLKQTTQAAFFRKSLTSKLTNKIILAGDLKIWTQPPMMHTEYPTNLL